MKHEWLAYAIVAVLSIGAGVAIAGLPSSEPADVLIVVPAATDATVPETVATIAPEVVTTAPPATTTTTTLAPEVVTTTLEPETTTTTVPEPPLPDRADLDVVVANGANIGGIAGATANRLEDLGYVDVRATDGSEIVFFTIVYHVEGSQASAERLAADLGLQITSVAPIADAPDVIGGLRGEALLVYVGSDQA